MRERRIGSTGSSRGRFFREPERRSTERHRPQRVKFRRQYAESVLRRVAMRGVKVTVAVTLLGGLAYGSLELKKFWSGSAALRVSGVRFEGDIPPALQQNFTVKPGDHLFKLKLKSMEDAYLKRFPELQTLSISRSLGRAVVIEGHYKKPRALMSFDNRTMGVYGDGTLFPITEHNPVDEKLPFITGASVSPARAQLVEALDVWKNDAPEFSALVKRLETDNIGTVRVVLDDGVVVQWGEMNENELLVHAANILNVLENFTPTKVPATLRVVSNNRIVMDSSWTRKTNN